MSRSVSKPSSLSLLVIVFAMSMLTACGSDNGPAAPGVEPEVINDPDVFQFQVSSVDGYTGTLQYAWSNTGTLANVDQSCSVQSGQAVLTLVDASGTEVYSRDLSLDGSSASSEGTAGDWQVRVVFTSVRGTLNFRVEKRTP